jgi:predicted small lipoprotein YifL
MNSFTNFNAVSNTKRRLVFISMAVCVALSGTFGLSGCGVRSGMERVDDAKQAKKQAEDVQHKLKKDLKKGQDY